jgi:hypothetical protein
MQPPIILPDNCSCTLTQASFAYSQPNIVSAGVIEAAPNGIDRLTLDAGAGPVDIILDNGLYSFVDVQAALNIWVRTHDDTGADAPPATPIVAGAAELFIFTGIEATQKLIISLNPAALAGGVFPAVFTLSFVNPSVVSGLNDSIGKVLGFPTTGPSATITAPPGGIDIYSVYAPFSAGFSDTSAYTLYMSLVTSSYQNGQTGQLLYSFPLGNFPTNSVIAFQPTRPYPVPLISGTFSSVRIWTADQSGNRLPWSLYQAPFQFSAIIQKNK